VQAVEERVGLLPRGEVEVEQDVVRVVKGPQNSMLEDPDAGRPIGSRSKAARQVSSSLILCSIRRVCMAAHWSVVDRMQPP